MTMLMKVGDEWRIRAQLFVTDSLRSVTFPSIESPRPLPPLGERIEANILGRTFRRTERRATYSQIALVMTEFRRAWNDRDPDAIASAGH